MAHKLVRRFLAVPAVAGVLAGAWSTSALAQNSPVGTWDIVLSGGQHGVAQVTFLNDFTLTGTEIYNYRIHNPVTASDADARNGGDSGRSPTPTVSGLTNVFGGADLGGTWTYDTHGRVVGQFVEVSRNDTNGVSFRAVVKPGARITMSGTHYPSGRKVSFRGIPLAPLADFSGTYFATGRRNGVPIAETYTFAPGPDVNSYLVAGIGPGYGLVNTNVAYISGLKYMAFYSQTTEATNGLVRTVSGTFSLTKKRGTLTGASESPNPSVSPAAQNLILKISPPGQ